MDSKTNSKLKIALLGTGGIAACHVTAIRLLPGLEVAAVCDIDRGKADAFAAANGIPQVFYNIESLLASRPDVVHVLLPPAAHAAATAQCLSAGVHVLVEKPFALHSGECHQLSGLATQVGRQVGVNHNYVFIPAFQRLVECIRRRELGAIEHVSVQFAISMPGLFSPPHTHWMFREPRNILLEWGPHPVSIICYLMGAVRQASTSTFSPITLSNGQVFFQDWMSSMDCERGCASLQIRFGSLNHSLSVHVLGQDGEAYVDLTRDTLRVHRKRPYLRLRDLADCVAVSASTLAQGTKNFARDILGTAGLQKPFLPQDVMVHASLRDFYQALSLNRPPTANASHATSVIEACELIWAGTSLSGQEGTQNG
jgi:predicted dehydrogenase